MMQPGPIREDVGGRRFRRRIQNTPCIATVQQITDISQLIERSLVEHRSIAGIDVDEPLGIHRLRS